MARSDEVDVVLLQDMVIGALYSVGQDLEPGTRRELFEDCSKPGFLVCLHALADSQLKLVAEDAGLDDLWKTGLQDHVVPRLYYNPLKLEELRSDFLNDFPFEDIDLPAAADEAEDIWRTDAWLIAQRVTTVLRAALCAAELAPAATPDIVPEAAIHIAAVLTCVSCDTISIIFNCAMDYSWFSYDHCGLPLRLLHTLLLEVRTVVHAIHMCHSLLVRLSPEVLEKVAYLMWNLLALSTAEFMDLLLETDDTGTSVPSSSTTPAGGQSADQNTSSGAEAGPSKGPAKPGKGKGKGKAKKKASKAQQGSGLSSSSQASAATGSGTTTGAAEAAPAAESQADRELRGYRQDARGLMVAALDAWALAVNISRQHGHAQPWSFDRDGISQLAEMADRTASLLSELILVPPPTLPEALQHQAELKPITWAAQIFNGLEKQDRAVLAPLPDSIWTPTCLSIGPAPMATAGAESVCNLAAFMRLSPHKVHPEDVLSCLRLTVTLTTLARRMAQEAADPAFVGHIVMYGGDVYALRSWCATTGAMCRVAYCQLATLQHINNGGRLGEGAIPEQFQPESYPLRREAQEKKKTAGLPSQEVQVLLPVMGAAALQLAHAALACVRIMDSKVIGPDGRAATMPLEHLSKTTAAELYSAQVSALELYAKLLSCAADKYIHAADAQADRRGAAAEGKRSSSSAPPGKAGASAPPPPSSSSSLAAAAAAAAGSLAGTEPSREGGQPGQLHVLPPSFARHCAAITAWGSSIRNLANIAVVALRAMNTESIVGTSEHLVSWLSGGTRIQQNLEIIELLASFAMYGEDLMEVTNGDLAGWLDDLAPRGDLSSSHLLYRMCCFWDCPPIIDQMDLTPHTGAWKAAKAAHHMLLPLLVLTYQVPQLSAEAPTSAQQRQQQQQQGGQPSAASSRATAAAAAAAKRAQQARDAFRAAVMSSPGILCTISGVCQAVPGMMQSVFEKVEQRVRCEGDKEGWIHALIQSWISNGGLDSHSLSAARQEPLPKMLKAEEAIWSAAWFQHNYTQREEAQHIKKLQAYVQAAADRAAEQLEKHPELVDSLMEALES